MNQQEQLKTDTAALSLPRGRRVGQPGHEVALSYLLQRFEQIGLLPFKNSSFGLSFSGSSYGGTETIRFTNIAGVAPGTNRELAPLLIGAHYDSVIDAPCADDNATAVAVALAIAQRFKTNPLERDLIVAIFDSEEPPYYLTPQMGSIRFYEDHCRELNFALCLIMDLIGHDVEIPNATLSTALPFAAELLAVTGCESHPALPAIFEAATKGKSGLRVLPTLNQYVGDMSDHHAFRLGGQPYLFLSCGEGRYYHTEQDDLSWINFSKLERVEEFIAALLVEADRQAPQVPWMEMGKEHDTAQFEIAQLSKVFGERLPLLLQYLGMGNRLKDRSDLTALYRQLAGIIRLH